MCEDLFGLVVAERGWIHSHPGGQGAGGGQEVRQHDDLASLGHGQSAGAECEGCGGNESLLAQFCRNIVIHDPGPGTEEQDVACRTERFRAPRHDLSPPGFEGGRELFSGPGIELDCNGGGIQPC